MPSKLRRLLFGKPLRSEHAAHERLSIPLALPIFASDALSSVAYATEAILIQLASAHLNRSQFVYAIPIGVGIIALILMVVISYWQIIFAYPEGGGAYIVARENLGEAFGLIAAASLLVDYVLTVAVSIAEGTAAAFSALEHLGGGFAHLATYRVEVCLLLLAIVTILNLRGVRESGAAFAGPSYLFIITLLVLIAWGGVRIVMGMPPVENVAPPNMAPIGVTGGLTLFLVLRAFSSGCSALTGIEAVSNGVPVFKKPESRNAAITLGILGVLLAIMFVGINALAHHYGVVPSEHLTDYGGVHREETVVSQVARATFGVGFLYYILQAATALILFLAANTSFAAFPRLAFLLAEHGYLPRQLANLGDRLAFHNGIFLLSLTAGAFIVAFHGQTYALLPLYTVGVFIAFSLSQGGMVVRGLRHKTIGPGMVINALGCLITVVVLCIVTYSKFWVMTKEATLFHIGSLPIQEGAWMAMLMMAILIWMFYGIRTHYTRLDAQLANIPSEFLRPFKHTVIVLVPSRIHRGVIQAINYARSMTPNAVAVHIAFNPAHNMGLQEAWNKYGGDVPLLILDSPYRTLTGPLMAYLDAADEIRSDDLITVILPEFVPAKWWHQFLHNASGFLLRRRLFQRRHTVLINVRYYLDE